MFKEKITFAINMIPKVIHYCWFGRNPKSDSVLKYIQTWRDKMPDYEIKEWNEDNFNVDYNAFTREAYYAKKYAFVSDVARLFALVKEGGIYLDTDIIILKHFPDKLLRGAGFAGFEHDKYIGTGIIGCEKNNKLIKAFLDSYSDRHFFKNYKFNTIPNVKYFTSLLMEHGLQANNQFQIIDGFGIYPQNIFCCKDCNTLAYYNDESSLSIHDFAGTWTDNENSILQKIKIRITEFLTIVKFWYL